MLIDLEITTTDPAELRERGESYRELADFAASEGNPIASELRAMQQRYERAAVQEGSRRVTASTARQVMDSRLTGNGGVWNGLRRHGLPGGGGDG